MKIIGKIIQANMIDSQGNLYSEDAIKNMDLEGVPITLGVDGEKIGVVTDVNKDTGVIIGATMVGNIGSSNTVLEPAGIVKSFHIEKKGEEEIRVFDNIHIVSVALVWKK